MKTIQFRDDGQDFLEWDIDKGGRVVACRPFQARIWCGCRVINHKTLKKGSDLLMHSRFWGGERRIIHPVAGIKAVRHETAP